MLTNAERNQLEVAFKNDFPGDRGARKRLLIAWKDRAFYAATAHYGASEAYQFRNKLLTLLNIVSAITVLFAANNKLFVAPTSSTQSIVLAVASLFTVLSTAIQYLLRYEERAIQHKLAANEFSNFKRKVERYLSMDEISNSLIHNLNRDYNFISKHYPLVSRLMWRGALERRVTTWSNPDIFEGPTDSPNEVTSLDEDAGNKSKKRRKVKKESKIEQAPNNAQHQDGSIPSST